MPLDLEKFAVELLARLKYVDPSKRLDFIKFELEKIEDPRDHKLAQTLIEIGLSGLNQPQSKTIVVLLHGIRTRAEWQGLVAKEFENSENVIVYPLGYDYFDAIRFWFPLFTRNKPINKICNELRHIQADHSGNQICVIAHSFGTYIVGKILSKNSDIHLTRLLLCGSVLPIGYKWNSLPNLPLVVNDVGAKDIWPVMAKLFSWGYGNSGTFGFKTQKVKDRYHNFGHSDYFEQSFVQRFWVPYLTRGQVISSEYDSSNQKSTALSFASIIPFKILIFILLLYLFVPKQLI